MGFVGFARTYKLLATEVLDGVHTYKLEETPTDQWYVSRVVDWVAADSWQPLKRQFFAPSGEDWKVERFEDIRRVDVTVANDGTYAVQSEVVRDADVTEPLLGALLVPLRVGSTASHEIAKHVAAVRHTLQQKAAPVVSGVVRLT